LHGPIPHGVGYLRNLRGLLLNDNDIDGTLPDTLGGMLYLQELDLRNNNISGTIPPALGMMPRLTQLSAQQNRISGSLPSSMGLLQALRNVELQENALQGPLPSALGLLGALLHINMSHNHLHLGLPSELGRLTGLTHLILNSNTPGLGSAIPSTLIGLDSIQVVELTNNSLNGLLPEFLRYFVSGGGNGNISVSLPQNMSSPREVHLTGNPYYCPLPTWSLQAYAGIHCLHCPGENYRLPDGSPDYTRTCSGHGICIDGEYCQCEAAWNGFSDDCSMLACPRTEVESDTGETELQYCNGVGTCYNTVNTSIVCPADPSGAVPNDDYVAYHVDCATNTMTLARCSCPPGFVQPRCAAFTATEAQNVLVTSPGTVAVQSQLLLTVVLAVSVAVFVNARCLF